MATIEPMSTTNHLIQFLFFMTLSVFMSCAETDQKPSSIANEDNLLEDSTFHYKAYQPQSTDLVISRSDYARRLEGFWLAQCIANWTGLITEMDKIGGDGLEGRGAGFYTRENWGGPDHPNIWQFESLDGIADTIDFVFMDPGEVWGADDDTDIEYIYQHLMYQTQDGKLSGAEIREGWLKHIYSDENTPFTSPDGNPENYLWVSNQTAHNLMLQGKEPPETSDPKQNPDYDMIDAQLTTEIFGLFAPARPDVALEIALLPIQTTARENAQWIAEFYVIMHALASAVDQQLTMKEQLLWMADQASRRFPANSYAADMYHFVKEKYESGVSWEEARDALHQRYQVEQAAGYKWSTDEKLCHGCFAAGINFGASLVSLFYGEGDLKETIKIGALAGWDSDNPTATWGGLLGFMLGSNGVEDIFGRDFSQKFNIHRTRGGFERGVDNFQDMAKKGVFVVDRVVQAQMQGGIDLEGNYWYIPNQALSITAAVQ